MIAGMLTTDKALGLDWSKFREVSQQQPKVWDPKKIGGRCHAAAVVNKGTGKNYCHYYCYYYYYCLVYMCGCICVHTYMQGKVRWGK